MNKLLLIINPAAGMSKKKFRVFQIADWFRRKGYEVTVLTTTKKGDAVEFVVRYAPENDLVVCCGGDGTLNEVITGSMRLACRKPIGYLPAGTTNDMARSLRLPSNIKKAAKIVAGENPVAQDIGSFNETQYFTYIASFGAFTEVSYATPQWLKNRLGHFAYVLDSVRRLGEIRPYRIKVLHDGAEEEGEFIFGSVSNSSSIGGVLHLDGSQVSLNDGRFEVLLIRNAPNLLEFQKILHDLKHRNFQNEFIEFFHTDRILLRFEQEADWTLDGEYAGGPREVEIKNLHDAVSLIRKEKPAEQKHV
jgi:YegS/Rv2252/BmrU family lipid kinase